MSELLSSCTDTSRSLRGINPPHKSLIIQGCLRLAPWRRYVKRSQHPWDSGQCPSYFLRLACGPGIACHSSGTLTWRMQPDSSVCADLANNASPGVLTLQAPGAVSCGSYLRSSCVASKVSKGHMSQIAGTPLQPPVCSTVACHTFWLRHLQSRPRPLRTLPARHCGGAPSHDRALSWRHSGRFLILTCCRRIRCSNRLTCKSVK